MQWFDFSEVVENHGGGVGGSSQGGGWGRVSPGVRIQLGAFESQQWASCLPPCVKGSERRQGCRHTLQVISCCTDVMEGLLPFLPGKNIQ